MQNTATTHVARWLGIFTAFAGLEHGYFEILQGNTRPDGLMIASIGPPCVPTEIWNACEPAMTILPSYLWTGIVSMLLGVVVAVWAIRFIHTRYGGAVLAGLSFLLLLFGGGIFPPVMGMIAGLVAARIPTSLPFWRKRRDAALTRALAALWPWPLVAFVVWSIAVFIIGALANDFFLNNPWLMPALILTTFLLAIFTGFATDASRDARRDARRDAHPTAT